MKPKDILLIEDNPADAKLAMEALLEASPSIRIITKSSGEEALDWLQGQIATDTLTTDLIFMDKNLPGKGGFEILKELNAHPRLQNIEVIVLSGSMDPDEQKAVKTYPRCFYRVKPGDLDGYIALMQELLKNFLAEQQM